MIDEGCREEDRVKFICKKTLLTQWAEAGADALEAMIEEKRKMAQCLGCEDVCVQFFYYNAV